MSHAHENRVGGYFGIGTSMSRTEFMIESNTFSPGEQIPITLQCNNTECKDTVKNFKFKLWRRSIFRMGNEIIETGEYLTSVKITGCKPKEAVRREYLIPLPIME
jgi:hypothetical protein